MSVYRNGANWQDRILNHYPPASDGERYYKISGPDGDVIAEAAKLELLNTVLPGNEGTPVNATNLNTILAAMGETRWQYTADKTQAPYPESMIAYLDFSNSYTPLVGSFAPTQTGCAIVEGPTAETKAVQGTTVNSGVDLNAKVIPLGKKTIRFRLKWDGTACTLVDETGGSATNFGTHITISEAGIITWTQYNGGSALFSVDTGAITQDKWVDISFAWNGTTDGAMVMCFVDGILQQQTAAAALPASEAVATNNTTLLNDSPLATNGNAGSASLLTDFEVYDDALYANTYVLDQTGFSLFDGARVRIKFHAAPSGSIGLLNINGTGNVPIQSGTTAGEWVELTYYTDDDVYKASNSGLLGDVKQSLIPEETAVWKLCDGRIYTKAEYPNLFASGAADYYSAAHYVALKLAAKNKQGALQWNSAQVLRIIGDKIFATHQLNGSHQMFLDTFDLQGNLLGSTMLQQQAYNYATASIQYFAYVHDRFIAAWIGYGAASGNEALWFATSTDGIEWQQKKIGTWNSNNATFYVTYVQGHFLRPQQTNNTNYQLNMQYADDPLGTWTPFTITFDSAVSGFNGFNNRRYICEIDSDTLVLATNFSAAVQNCSILSGWNIYAGEKITRCDKAGRYARAVPTFMLGARNQLCAVTDDIIYSAENSQSSSVYSYYLSASIAAKLMAKILASGRDFGGTTVNLFFQQETTSLDFLSQYTPNCAAARVNGDYVACTAKVEIDDTSVRIVPVLQYTFCPTIFHFNGNTTLFTSRWQQPYLHELVHDIVPFQYQILSLTAQQAAIEGVEVPDEGSTSVLLVSFMTPDMKALPTISADYAYTFIHV